jgi:hypothetical protein
MLRLIIKFTLLFLIIYYIYTHPIPVACFCGDHSWWNKCIEGTDSSSLMCKEIDLAINTINDKLTVISKGLSTVYDTLSQDIPKIPTNIPKVAELVSSKYTNYTINPVPQIPSVSMSCSVTIPLSSITNQTNIATSQITNQLNNITNQINSSPFFTAINDIVNQMNNIKNKIDAINFGQKINIGNLKLNCDTGYQLNGLVCVPNPPDGYAIHPGDVINYWLTESTSYPMGIAQTANQDNSACNNLAEPKSYGIGTCTGWKGDLNCHTRGCGCIKQAVNQDNSACNNLSSVTHGIGTCTGWKGDIYCRTRGCGCIKGWVSKDCSSCDSLCNVSIGVDTCTGIKR